MNNLMYSIFLNAGIMILIFIIVTAPTWNLALVTFRIEAKPRIELYQNFIINCLIISIVLYEAAKLGLNLRITSFAVLAMMLLSLIIQYLQNKSNFQTIKPFIHLLIIFVASTWAIFPSLLKISKNGMKLGLGSIGNNDVINYALMSKDFLINGFSDGGAIANVNLGYNNHFLQHQTANSLITFISSVTGFESWKLLTAIAGIVIAIGINSLGSLVECLFQISDRRISHIIGSIVFLTPLMSYVIGNYFLAQLIAVPVAVEILRILLHITKSNKLFIDDYFLLPITTALCVFAYPVFLIPWLFICVIISSFYVALNRNFLSKITMIRIILLISLGFVIAVDYLFVALKLGSMQGTTNFGWSLEPLNPLSALILPGFIGEMVGNGFTILSWIIFLILCGIFITKSKVELDLKKFFLIYSAVNVLLVLGIYAFKSHSLSSYQVWKLQSFLFPIVLVMLLVVAYKSNRLGKLIILIIGIFSLFSPLQLWEKSLNSPDLVINSEMTRIVTNPKLLNLDSVNIDLNPYFENMAMATILQNKHKYMKGLQYYPSIANDSACTLMRIANRNYEFIEPLSANYALAPSVDGKCSPKQLKLNVESLPRNSLFKFNKDASGVRLLGIGWFNPETWGTWSTQEKSTLFFKSNFQHSRLSSFELKVVSFLPSETSAQILRVYFNGKQVFKEEIDSQNPLKSINFNGEVLPDGQRNEITFQISPIYSPKDSGLSTDPRHLGVGLISILLN